MASQQESSQKAMQKCWHREMVGSVPQFIRITKDKLLEWSILFGRTIE